jgi:superfamily II DNA or RNA helicase
MINNICNFQPRIEFIREIISDILKIEPDRKILLLSDRRNHLENMKELFDKHNMSCGLYYGGLKQEALKISETKQILLATFNMTAEGFDLPSLNTLVLASPKSDIIQASGRILREKEECRKYQPLIIDIVDKFSIFNNQAKKRVVYYKKSKYDIQT